jgi:hypothetical protein
MSFGKRQPIGFCGVDRRRGVREQTDVPAQIVLPGGHVVNCSVTDVSKSGARLVVPTAFGLPDTFELWTSKRSYQASITRRGRGHVGVRFI